MVRPGGLRRPSAWAWAAGAVLVLLWLWVWLRAARIGFTADEVTSAWLVDGARSWAQGADNHLVNTVLMGVSHRLLGSSELAWRLPNVAAFAIYGAAVLWGVTRLCRPAARLAWLAVILGDAFLLQFFALARGYGISLAFALAAICLAVWPAPADRPLNLRAVRAVLLAAAGAVSFYANFSALNTVLAAWAVAAASAVAGDDTGQFGGVAMRLRRATPVLVAVGVGTALLVPGIIRLHWLQHTGELYYGGRRGVAADTVRSLAQTFAGSYSYGIPRPVWTTLLGAAVIAVGALALAASLARFRRQRGFGPAQRAALAAVLAATATELEARLGDAPFPVDRAALGDVLLLAVLVATALDGAPERLTGQTPSGHGLRQRLPLAAAAAVAGAVTVLFLVRLDATVAVTWEFDRSSRRVIDAVAQLARADRPSGRPWRLVSGFPQNYSLEWYREQRHLSAVAPITLAPVSTPGADLYLIAVGALQFLPAGTRIVATFPGTDLQLRAAPTVPAPRASRRARRVPALG